MPPTDKGGRGYSDKLVAELQKELQGTATEQSRGLGV